MHDKWTEGYCTTASIFPADMKADTALLTWPYTMQHTFWSRSYMILGRCQARNCLCAPSLQMVLSCLHAASTCAQQAKDKSAPFDTIELAYDTILCHCIMLICTACCTGSSVPSGYSGSGFASISGLGSRPSHSIDVSRPAAGDAQRFAAQVCLTP